MIHKYPYDVNNSVTFSLLSLVAKYKKVVKWQKSQYQILPFFHPRIKATALSSVILTIHIYMSNDILSNTYVVNRFEN